jgi:hypothetical protein
MLDDANAENPPATRRCSQVLEGGRRRLVVGVALLCCPAASYASEWSFDPAVTVALGYESNAALTTDPHNSVSEMVLVPEITVRRLTETSAVNIGLLGKATYYSGNEFEDTHEAQLALSSFVQSTERAKLGLGVVSRWDSLFEWAALGTGTGNIQDVDIGLVNTVVRRNWREVQPTMTYALSERGWAVFRYRLTDVKFGDVGTTGLVDYQQHYLSGTYSYQLTVANDLNVVVQNARYRPVAGTDSDSTALLVGIFHKFSPTANGGLHAGIGKTTETMSDGSQVDTSTFVFEARAAQQAELSRLEALISRDVQPTGSGKSVSADQLRVDWNQMLSPVTAFSLRATVFRNKVLEGSDPLVDRRYAEAEAGFGWILAPEWSFRIAYQYRHQKYDAAVDAARSNGMVVAVAWAPPRRH